MSEWDKGTEPDHDAETFRATFGSLTHTSQGAPIPVSQLPSLPPGTHIGEYEIDQRIGEGAMSEVFVAVHRTIGRRVAIKVLNQHLFADPEAKERFISEARAAAEIHHPNIVHVFGFGHFDDGRAYIIMEWLRGESLGARLQRGPIRHADALDIILQMTGALRAAHGHDIIHRDLKPDNVFLQDVKDEKPVVKILDFGLAKRSRGGRVLTLEGQLLGTPLYMSPEQCRGKDVDHRTDIYALGCIWYQLLTGRPPFDVATVAELVMAHVTQTPRPPRELSSDVPVRVDALVRAMLAKDPQQRPTLAGVRASVQGLLGLQTATMPVVKHEELEPTIPERNPIRSSQERTTLDGKLRAKAPRESDFQDLDSDIGQTVRLRTSDPHPLRVEEAPTPAAVAKDRSRMMWLVVGTLALIVALLVWLVVS